jgi:hypothetical protein
VVLFACLVGGFGFALWQASNKAPSQQQTNRPSETKENAQPVPASVAIPANQTHAADNRNDAKDGKRWLANFLDIKLTDLLIAIFTGVLAWKTAGLFRETEGLRTAADRQKEDFLRSVQAAEKAAFAAENSANAIVDNERPWVGLVTIVGIQIGPGRPIEAKVVIQNTGHTPARHMRAAFRGSTTAATAACGDAPDVNLTPQKALFPNIPDYYYPFHGHRVLTDDEFRAIVNGTRILWVVGRIEYLDNRGIQRWTDVCARWEQSRGEYVPNWSGNDAS